MTIKYSAKPIYRNIQRATIQRREKREAVREFIRELMGGQCVECGGTEMLHAAYIGKGKFHELDYGSTYITVLMEQSKQYVLYCKLCWWIRFKAKYNRGTPQHGTVSMYTNKKTKCRCTSCRAAWNTYSKAWHKKKYAKRRVAKQLLKKGGFNFLKH